MQALQETTLLARLQPSNAVTALRLVEESLPIAATPAGEPIRVAVIAKTEDGKTLAAASAKTGLALQVTAPGARRAKARRRHLPRP